jgi:hypothetical protein
MQKFTYTSKILKLTLLKMPLYKVIPKKHAKLGLKQKSPNLVPVYFLGVTFLFVTVVSLYF